VTEHRQVSRGSLKQRHNGTRGLVLNLSDDTPHRVRLLAVDNDAHDLELLRGALAHDEIEVLSTSDPDRALAMLSRERPAIVVLNLTLTRYDEMSMLERMVEADPGANIILVSAYYSTDYAVEAIRKGARDYLTKPLDLGKLRERVSGLLAEHRERKRTLELDRELLKVYQLEGIIGRSPLMLEVFASVRRAAPHFRTVLVTGPTGTGKELVARALHRLSPVAGRQLAVCNCSALVETLLESELFGYVRGAFTGAVEDKLGLFEYASGGCLFLDEIGDLPQTAQAKLLRVLDNQEVQPVGSPAVKKVDTRVIAATHRDLAALVAEGKFREDLFYRLSMIEIHLPRLADRKEDLPLLQRHFLEEFAAQYEKPIHGITRRAQSVLARHSWPGNVREFENVLGRACMMTDRNVIDIADLPRSLIDGPPALDDDLASFDELQQRHLLRVLEKVGGNKARAAEILGISRATLYTLLGKARLKQKQTDLSARATAGE
jgi:DNA-binding NtrC family response regulator